METELESMGKKLIEQLEKTARELKKGSGKIIDKIYIGKTYILIKKKPSGEKILFNNLNPDTWKMTGIGSRWADHYKQGRHGLVVLGAITSETVPNTSNKPHEQIALMMEQKLLHHYVSDLRVENDTFTAGKLAKKDHCASCVYMAFKYAVTVVEAQSDDHPPQVPLGAANHTPSEAGSHSSFPTSITDDESHKTPTPLHSPAQPVASAIGSPEAQTDTPTANETDDTLLGEGSPQSDSPPDDSLLDLPAQEEGPSHVSPDMSQGTTHSPQCINNDSSDIVMLDSRSDSDMESSSSDLVILS